MIVAIDPSFVLASLSCLLFVDWIGWKMFTWWISHAHNGIRESTVYWIIRVRVRANGIACGYFRFVWGVRRNKNSLQLVTYESNKTDCTHKMIAGEKKSNRFRCVSLHFYIYLIFFFFIPDISLSIGLKNKHFVVDSIHIGTHGLRLTIKFIRHRGCRVNG